MEGPFEITTTVSLTLIIEITMFLSLNLFWGCIRIFTKYGLSFFKDKEELLEIQPTPVKAFPTLHRNNSTQFINNSSQKNSNLCKSNSSQEKSSPSQENSTLCQKNSDSTHNNSNSTENNSNLPKNNSKSRQNNSKSSQNNSNSTGNNSNSPGNNSKTRQNNSNSPHNNSKLPCNNSDSTQNNSNSLKNKYNSNSQPNNSNSAEPNLSELSITKHLEDLCTLQAGNKIDSMYMMEKSAWTYYILFLLRQLKFFNNSDQLGEDEILIGRFIELFLKISDNNCHEISELDAGDIEEIRFSSLQEREDLNRIVGVGIYLCSSFFNNSCDVNTMKYHDGRTEVMQAKRKIRAGEEVADYYGEHFFLTDKYSRRRNFGFSCSCKACKEGWPLLDELEVFTPEQLQNRLDWVVNRVELGRSF